MTTGGLTRMATVSSEPTPKQQLRDLYEIKNDKLALNFHPGQKQAWVSKARFTAILAGTQSGKALSLDTLIPTSRGFIPMGEVRDGDTVYDEIGQPCSVVKAHDVLVGRECFRVTFDDGTSVVADGDHLWQTQTFPQRKNLARRVLTPNPGWSDRPQCQPRPTHSVVTTRTIRDTLNHDAKHRNHSVRMSGPVEFPEKVLPIPPYTLGVWLGDGFSSGASIVTADPEILDSIRDDGFAVGKARDGNAGLARLYTIGTTRSRGGNDRSNPFLNALRSAGLLGNKHIPAEYMTASVNQRLALLQGLMDTDGSVGRYCEFTSTVYGLARGVLSLAWSLGIKARIRSRETSCQGKAGKTAYRVTFSTTRPVFRLKRKLERIKHSIRSDAENRYIVSVDPVESVPVRCLTVDSPNRLYLCGESCIPTHNTSWGPIWLYREIYGGLTHNRKRGGGSGDYLAVTATFDLFKLKMLPAILELFETILGVGRYWGVDRVIELRDPVTGKFWAKKSTDPMWGRIILRSAESGGGLESATAKAAWLDEAGLDSFSTETWHAVLSRLTLNEGRVLITTTLYNFGWLKTEFYDRWKAGDKDYRVVHFDSNLNPLFPEREWERAKSSMQPWKFNLRYRGRFSRPAGLIYDSYHDEPAPLGHLVPRFVVPWTWPRYIGVDFGGVNTAAVIFAEDLATKQLYAIREYLAGDLTSQEHVDAIRFNEPLNITRCVGGSLSEDQWRREFTRAGLRVHPPDISEVEVGISRVYAAFKSRSVLVFDDLTGLRTELTKYSRKLDSKGEPTSRIEDKEKYHRLDCCRYILGWLVGPAPGETVRVVQKVNTAALKNYRGTSRSIDRFRTTPNEY